MTLMSLLGRPDGKVVAKYSLAPVAKEVEAQLGRPVRRASLSSKTQLTKHLLTSASPPIGSRNPSPVTRLPFLRNLRPFSGRVCHSVWQPEADAVHLLLRGHGPDPVEDRVFSQPVLKLLFDALLGQQERPADEYTRLHLPRLRRIDIVRPARLPSVSVSADGLCGFLDRLVYDVRPLEAMSVKRLAVIGDRTRLLSEVRSFEVILAME